MDLQESTQKENADMKTLQTWATKDRVSSFASGRRNRRFGFTLIELLVVILILAILAALIVPKVVGKTGDAKVAAAKSDLATVSSALQNFRLDNDRYPTSEEGLQALSTQPASGATNWKGPYLTKPVGNDPWGNPYVYQFPGPNGNDSYMLESYGSDGAPGGEGDAQDIIEGSQ
jgi:general secretion pathway protein G